MTPRPPAANTGDLPPVDPRRLASMYRIRWQRLLDEAATYHLDRDQALDLVTCALELGKLGYVLTADEADWQPPVTEEADNDT